MSVAPLLEPMDAVFLSILVEQEKEIISLRQSVQKIPNSDSNRHLIFIIPDTLRELFRNPEGASQPIKL